MKITSIRYFGFLLDDVTRLYSVHFGRMVRARTGLTLAQCRFLGVLASHRAQKDSKPLSQQKLAERMRLAKTSMVHTCDRMAAAGWIRRMQQPEDHRANLIIMEPKAYEALEATIAAGEDLADQALSTLTAEERELLLQLLERVYAHQHELSSLAAAAASPQFSSAE